MGPLEVVIIIVPLAIMFATLYGFVKLVKWIWNR